MQRRGSALIISLFLITLVGGMSFSLGRLLFAESFNSNAQENGVQAFYAAESGMEEGFLRYRYNQNYEVPFPNATPSLGYVPGGITGYRTNTTSLTSLSNPIPRTNTISTTDRTSQVYDLRMGSQVTTFGNSSGPTTADCNNINSPTCIIRDEAKKFQVDFKDNNNINLQFIGVAPSNNSIAGTPPFEKPECVLLEVKITGKINIADDTQERKKMLYNGNASCVYPTTMLNTNAGKAIPLDSYPYTPLSPSAGSTVTITSIKNLIWPSSSLVGDTEISIKPIGANIAFSIQKVGAGKLYGPTSKIESYGYYDGVSRGLTADIDRQSGTLYDLFDYVIYKATK